VFVFERQHTHTYCHTLSASCQSFELRSTYVPFTSVWHSRMRSAVVGHRCQHMPLCTYIGRSLTNIYWHSSADHGLLTVAVDTRVRSSPLRPSLALLWFRNLVIPDSGGSEYWKIRRIRKLPDSELTTGSGFRTCIRHTFSHCVIDRKTTMTAEINDI